MITYRHDSFAPFKMTVKLDRKVIGWIRREIGVGYYYRTKSGAEGQRFHTVEEVKRSLEQA